MDLSITYTPKGGMCAGCVKKEDDCSALPFNSMQVLERSANQVIVRCTYFKKEE